MENNNLNEGLNEDDEEDDDDNDVNHIKQPQSTKSNKGIQSWRNVRAVMAYYCSLRKIKRNEFVGIFFLFLYFLKRKVFFDVSLLLVDMCLSSEILL